MPPCLTPDAILIMPLFATTLPLTLIADDAAMHDASARHATPDIFHAPTFHAAISPRLSFLLRRLRRHCVFVLRVYFAVFAQPPPLMFSRCSPYRCPTMLMPPPPLAPSLFPPHAPFCFHAAHAIAAFMPSLPLCCFPIFELHCYFLLF